MVFCILETLLKYRSLCNRCKIGKREHAQRYCVSGCWGLIVALLEAQNSMLTGNIIIPIKIETF